MEHRFGRTNGIVGRLLAVVVVMITAIAAGERANAEAAAPLADAVLGEALVLEPDEVVLGPATVITSAGAATGTAPSVATGSPHAPVQVQVLSSELERLVELPHTGVRTSMLVATAAALLGLGGVLVRLGGLDQRAGSSATAGR